MPCAVECITPHPKNQSPGTKRQQIDFYTIRLYNRCPDSLSVFLTRKEESMSITLEQLSAKMRQGEQVPLQQTAQIVLTLSIPSILQQIVAD